MKFAFTTLACPAWTIEQIAEAACELGYDGVELRLLDGEVIDPTTDRAKVGQAVELIRASGAEVCALDTSCKLNHADASARVHQIASVRQWVELAAEMRVPLVRVFGGAGDGDQATTTDEADGWVADALRQVAPDAERANVTVALETHDAFASARRVAHVLDAVASSHIAALWDSESPYRMGETAEDVIAVLGSRIAHVHVKDARRVSAGGPDWQLVPIGEGEIPIREQLEALHRLGYIGYVSVEWEKKWHPELAAPEVALPQHIAWLRGAVPGRTMAQ